MTTDMMDKSTAAKFIKRFRQLQEERSKLDFELAGLAHEIRQEFPKGASGDHQCRLWMTWNLEIYGGTANMLVKAARAFVLFPDVETWHNLGGWSSIGFLCGFKAGNRRKIAKQVLRLVEARGRTAGYGTVRNMAASLGCGQERINGRPNRLQVEEDLGLLRAYVAKQIKAGVLDANEMPEGVLTAMVPTRLAAIAHALEG